jgi:hypothetical protein
MIRVVSSRFLSLKEHMQGEGHINQTKRSGYSLLNVVGALLLRYGAGDIYGTTFFCHTEPNYRTLFCQTMPYTALGQVIWIHFNLICVSSGGQVRA